MTPQQQRTNDGVSMIPSDASFSFLVGDLLGAFTCLRNGTVSERQADCLPEIRVNNHNEIVERIEKFHRSKIAALEERVRNLEAEIKFLTEEA